MQNADFSPVRIAVIGGGAAGLMAAGTATAHGALVTVFDTTGPKNTIFSVDEIKIGILCCEVFWKIV